MPSGLILGPLLSPNSPELSRAGLIAPQAFQRSSSPLVPQFSEAVPNQLRLKRPMSPAALAERISNGRWVRAPHLALLDSWLLDLTARRRRRIIVQMPPRHGKSEHVSRYFSAWYLGMNPQHRIILSSYEATFARSWGRRSKEVLKNWGPELFGVSVKGDTSAANDWEIEGGDGGMLTAGIGGPITGRGADLFIVDDPVKNAQDAASEAIRERNWDWWRSTARTRFEPDAVAVIIMTRWHDDDLVGRILAEDEDEWDVLSLPALAEAGDPLGREIGQPLWPRRFPVPALEQLKASLGSYYWSALYQQRPTPEEGGIFKRSWWQRYSHMPKEARIGGIFVDNAHSLKTTADYSVVATVRTDGTRLFWENVLRGRWEFPELERIILAAREESKLPVYIEDTPGAAALIQSLRKLMPVVPIQLEGKDKVTWAHATAPYVEAGLCFVPYQASWLDEWLDEHAAFPNGAHDDQVDTTTKAIARLARLGFGDVPAAIAMRQPRAPTRRPELARLR